jgi:hypothetical protein
MFCNMTTGYHLAPSTDTEPSNKKNLKCSISQGQPPSGAGMMEGSIGEPSIVKEFFLTNNGHQGHRFVQAFSFLLESSS